MQVPIGFSLLGVCLFYVSFYQRGLYIVEVIKSNSNPVTINLLRVCTIEVCIPMCIQSDSGTEFVSKYVDLWAY